MLSTEKHLGTHISSPILHRPCLDPTEIQLDIDFSPFLAEICGSFCLTLRKKTQHPVHYNHSPTRIQESLNKKQGIQYPSFTPPGSFRRKKSSQKLPALRKVKLKIPQPPTKPAKIKGFYLDRAPKPRSVQPSFPYPQARYPPEKHDPI